MNLLQTLFCMSTLAEWTAATVSIVDWSHKVSESQQRIDFVCVRRVCGCEVQERRFHKICF